MLGSICWQLPIVEALLSGKQQQFGGFVWANEEKTRLIKGKLFPGANVMIMKTNAFEGIRITRLTKSVDLIWNRALVYVLNYVPFWSFFVVQLLIKFQCQNKIKYSRNQNGSIIL